ncbi:hypothetical protein LEN26_010702 [Aphanomyces euteiches]|nr:hypothetical protein LEN26_010702 [Aphanomyces euteiches]
MFFGGGHGNPFDVNFGFGHGYPERFDEHYRVYPVSFCDKAHLEDGDKILLPPSALETLARLHIDYPMLFKIKNEAVERISHCGVLEFSAPEGSCYMPYWMMQNMFLTEGGIVNIQNVTLPKATFAKIRPQSTDFHDITNPRAVLEATLRKFSCMTIGDTISIKYNNKNYLLDVRELRPADAVCIIETDCELDFDAPADYVPPVPVAPAVAAPVADLPYGGVPTVKSEDIKGKTLGFGGGLRLKKAGGETDADAMRAARLRKYEAFHGTGVSLTGRTSSTPPISTIAAPAPTTAAPQQDAKPPAAPFEGFLTESALVPSKAKSIKVDSKSLVDLQAVIYKKEQEKRHGVDDQESVSLRSKRGARASKSDAKKSNPGLAKRMLKDDEVDELGDDERAKKKRSRQILIEKARLYDELAIGAKVLQTKDSSLVDFSEKSEGGHKPHEFVDGGALKAAQPSQPPMEVQDEFGRTITVPFVAGTKQPEETSTTSGSYVVSQWERTLKEQEKGFLHQVHEESKLAKLTLADKNQRKQARLAKLKQAFGAQSQPPAATATEPSSLPNDKVSAQASREADAFLSNLL